MTDDLIASTPADGVDDANAADHGIQQDAVPPTHGDGGDTTGAINHEKDDRQDSPMAVDFVDEPLSDEYRGHSLMASQHAPSMLPAGVGAANAETTQYFPALKKRSAVANPLRSRTSLPLEQTSSPSAKDSTLMRPGQTFAAKRVFTIPSPTAPSQSSSFTGDGVEGMSKIVNTPLTEVTAPDRTEPGAIFEVKLDGSTSPVTSLPADVVWYRPSDKTGVSVGPYVGLTGVRDGAAADSAAGDPTSAPLQEEESGARNVGISSDSALQTDRQTTSSRPQHSFSAFRSQPTVSTAGIGLFGQPPGTSTQPLTSFGQPSPSLFRPPNSSSGHAQPLSPFDQLPAASNQHRGTTFGSTALNVRSSFGPSYTTSSRPSTSWFGQPSPSFLRPSDSSSDRKSLSFGQHSSASFSQKTGTFGQPSTVFGQPATSSAEPSTALAPMSPFTVTSTSMQRPTAWDIAARERERAMDDEAWHQSDQAPIKPIKEDLEDGEIEMDDPSGITVLSPWSRRKMMPPPPQILVPIPKFPPTPSAAADHGLKDKGQKQVNAKKSPVDKHREVLLNIAKDRIVSKNGGLSVVIEAWEAVLEDLKQPRFQRKINSTISAAMHERHRKQRAEMDANMIQEQQKMAARAEHSPDRHKQQAFEAFSRDLRHDRRNSQKRQLHYRQSEDNSRVDDRFD